MVTKKQILVVAKLALSAGLIYWLLQGADLETIWVTVQSARVGALLLAFLMFYIGFGLIALRWQLLLKVENIEARFLYLFKSINIAVLFNNLLPSTIGGDAYRMYDVWRLGGTKTKAIAVILIDRFLGMFALVTYGVIAALLVPEVRQAIPGLVFYLVAILVKNGAMGKFFQLAPLLRMVKNNPGQFFPVKGPVSSQDCFTKIVSNRVQGRPTRLNNQPGQHIEVDERRPQICKHRGDC